MKIYDLGSYSFPDPVECKDIVPLAQGLVRKGGTCDNRLPNIYDFDLMGTPRYIRVHLMSIICSVAVLAATNSDPYVPISTVACFLEYQSVGVWLQKWRHAVSDAAVARQ